MTPALVTTIGREAALVEAESGRRVDRAELVRLVDEAAAGLAALRLDGSDRLAILAPQTIDWYVIHLAADRLGLLTVPLNTRYADAEIIGMLEASLATVVAVDPSFLGRDFAAPVRAAQARPRSQIRTVLTLGDTRIGGWPGLGDLTGPAVTDQPTTSIGLICFGTSGTTSAPKLAVHSRFGVETQLQAVCDRLDVVPADTVMALLPPSGAYGYTVALTGLAAGAEVVLVAAFRPDSLGGLVHEHGGTVLAVTEPILRAALAADGPGGLATVRVVASAGATVTDLAAELDACGVCLVNVYGASEVLALAAIRSVDLAPSERARPGGSVVPVSLSIRVVDETSGDAVGVGGEGELQFKGPTVFTGYLGQEQATAEAFTEDGWYRTKDRARLDGTSTFSYLSRAADTMRLKGYLVDPAQIEGVLMAHPDVTEAQVVGIPDPASGEDRAVAFIVSASPDRPTLADELVEWCRERLARYKIPTHVLVVDDIPLTTSANGDKALKRTLRERAKKILEGTGT